MISITGVYKPQSPSSLGKTSSTLHKIYILTCLRLPGTPLWLIAVYTDSFASINKYWVPAMW